MVLGRIQHGGWRAFSCSPARQSGKANPVQCGPGKLRLPEGKPGRRASQGKSRTRGDCGPVKEEESTCPAPFLPGLREALLSLAREAVSEWSQRLRREDWKTWTKEKVNERINQMNHQRKNRLDLQQIKAKALTRWANRGELKIPKEKSNSKGGN